MATRREVLKATSGLLSPEISSSSAGDARIAALLQDFQRNDQARAKLARRRDRIERAAWERGDEACPHLATIETEIDGLDAAEAALSMKMANQPADGFLGVAFKLALWRLEAVKSGALGLDQPHDAFAFSAYADVLRLTGLESLSHPLDARTARLMRRGTWTADGRD